MHHISCGNCGKSHSTVEGVRRCHPGEQVAPCDWLYGAGLDEDGEGIVLECGTDSWITERGWACANGHEHVSLQVRMAEGWDYAGDEGEAFLLRQHGVDAVAMDGGSI